MRGAVIPCRTSFCTAELLLSGKARSSSRSSNAATAIRSETWADKEGPALDSVAVRLTQDQLIRQVIQGGGNMPAYGKNLSPAETTALGRISRDVASSDTGASARCCSRRGLR